MLSFFIGLAAFGVGVTIIDLFGAFGHLGGHDSGGHDAGGHDAGGHDSGGHDHHDIDDEGRGSVFGAPDSKIRIVTRIVSTLRLIVNFAAGAGPTGIVALATGVGAVESGLWSVAGGALFALISTGLRKLARRELDSSVTDDELIMECAEIDVPTSAGMLGRAIVRAYGTERAIFVRAKDPLMALAKGATVRIVEISDECCIVEPAEDAPLGIEGPNLP